MFGVRPRRAGGSGLRGFLGLGSNVGDRHANLRAARAALARPHLTVVASSSVYETAPQGLVLDQPPFLNAALEVDTGFDPLALLGVCKDVERELGRTPGGPRHGPRPIDVDVLLLDGVEYSSERLTVPHRDLLDRRFVLVPLLELDATLTLPDGTSLIAALARVEDQDLTRVGPL